MFFTSLVFYIENPLFSLSVLIAGNACFKLRDCRDATHLFAFTIPIKQNFDDSIAGVIMASSAIVSVLFLDWFKSSKFIAFHGSFLGNPTFPLLCGNVFHYIKSAI